MTDRERPDGTLTVRSHKKKSRPFRSADPFVAVASVVSCSEFLEIKWQHSGRVRAIHQGINSAACQFTDDFPERKNQTSLARDMIDQEQPRTRCHALQNRVYHHTGVAERKRDFGEGDGNSSLLRNYVQRVAARIILMIADDNLISALERERAQDRVKAGSRIRNEGEILRVGAEELRERISRLVEQIFEIAHEELNRLPLHPEPHRLLIFHNGFRATAE